MGSYFLAVPYQWEKHRNDSLAKIFTLHYNSCRFHNCDNFQMARLGFFVLEKNETAGRAAGFPLIQNIVDPTLCMGSPNFVPNEGKSIMHCCLHSCNYFAFTESLLSYKLSPNSVFKSPRVLYLFSPHRMFHYYNKNIWLLSRWEILLLDKCLLLTCLREHLNVLILPIINSLCSFSLYRTFLFSSIILSIKIHFPSAI